MGSTISSSKIFCYVSMEEVDEMDSSLNYNDYEGHRMLQCYDDHSGHRIVRWCGKGWKQHPERICETKKIGGKLMAIPKMPSKKRDTLPKGWTKHLDKDSGKDYYYHADTEESRWDHPGSKPLPGLPAGWTEHQDPNTNTSYYYHAETKKSQWELPERRRLRGIQRRFLQA